MKKIREKFVAVTILVMVIIMTLGSICNSNIIEAAETVRPAGAGIERYIIRSNEWYRASDWSSDIFKGEGKSCNGQKFSVAKFIVDGGYSNNTGNAGWTNTINYDNTWSNKKIVQVSSGSMYYTFVYNGEKYYFDKKGRKYSSRRSESTNANAFRSKSNSFDTWWYICL